MVAFRLTFLFLFLGLFFVRESSCDQNPTLDSCIDFCDDCFDGQPLCRLAGQPNPDNRFYLRGLMKSGTLWLDSIVHTILQKLADAHGWNFQTDAKNRIHHLLQNQKIILTWTAENDFRHKTRLNHANNILIVRDPRATLRSSHFFFTQKELPKNSKVPMDEAQTKLNQFLVWESVFASELCSPNASYLQFHYEMLQADPIPLLRIITEYLGYKDDLSDKDLQDVVDENSVLSLKKKEMSNSLVGGVGRPNADSRAHIRDGNASGVSMDWSLNYEEEVLAYIEKEMCASPISSTYLSDGREMCRMEEFCMVQRKQSNIETFYG